MNWTWKEILATGFSAALIIFAIKVDSEKAYDLMNKGLDVAGKSKYLCYESK